MTHESPKTFILIEKSDHGLYTKETVHKYFIFANFSFITN